MTAPELIASLNEQVADARKRHGRQSPGIVITTRDVDQIITVLNDTRLAAETIHPEAAKAFGCLLECAENLAGSGYPEMSGLIKWAAEILAPNQKP